MRVAMVLSPKLRRVGNPMGLLAHVEDYTLRELDLRNEIRGAKRLRELQMEVESSFPMDRMRLPRYWAELSNAHVLVSEYIPSRTLDELVQDSDLSWEDLLALFRIHGAYMFGLGTFHGDLHPGNCILDDEGRFVFIDNGSICEAPEHVRSALFAFFEHLSLQRLPEAYDALLTLSQEKKKPKRINRYRSRMSEIYEDFEAKTAGEQSLTKTMMETVKAAVEDAGANFGEEAFPIIRSLMYMDGLVISAHPDVRLVRSMGPYLQEFRDGLGVGDIPANFDAGTEET